MEKIIISQSLDYQFWVFKLIITRWVMKEKQLKYMQVALTLMMDFKINNRTMGF